MASHKSKKLLTILGSTGSIGTSTLDIVQKNPGSFQILGLSAGKNLTLLKNQISEFKPQRVSVTHEEDARTLKSWLKEQKNLPSVQVGWGEEGVCEVACIEGTQLVIAGMVGAVGLPPVLKAIQKGINIGLANKETMVIAGELINEAARKSGAKILPVDSEHNALFQAMEGHHPQEIRKIILTASGGPFRENTLEQLQKVTPKQALKHPNWDMGAKITIDSATMMNKGLEVIEALFLFNIPVEKIEIVVHPQSIVHSMVEYIDGSVIAQLGIPDMRVPISYVLGYPNRVANDLPPLDLVKAQKLEFYAPDRERFPAIRLAYEALQVGKTMPAVLNAANEVAIPYFLEGRIGFLDIPKTVERVMQTHEKNGISNSPVTLESLLEADRWARETTERLIGN